MYIEVSKCLEKAEWQAINQNLIEYISLIGIQLNVCELTMNIPTSNTKKNENHCRYDELLWSKMTLLYAMGYGLEYSQYAFSANLKVKELRRTTN